MGAKNSKKIDNDTNSLSSVFEYLLNPNSAKNKSSPKKESREDIINELKEDVNLPIENEQNDSPEIIFEKKEELKIKDFFENDDTDDNDILLNKFYPEDLFNFNRSKTFAPKPVILETPHLQPKHSDIHLMSPFQLSSKSFGIIPDLNQKPNQILLDFQRDIMDGKSCNDIDILDEFLLYNTDSEKTTPNKEDMQNLLDCRKKMIKFRNSINYYHCHEYENILNCDSIIEDIYVTHPKKKKSIFSKYIQQQINEEKNKSYMHKKRLYSVPFDEDSKEDLDLKKEDEKKDIDDDLFFLGIIEKAYKGRKRKKNIGLK